MIVMVLAHKAGREKPLNEIFESVSGVWRAFICLKYWLFSATLRRRKNDEKNNVRREQVCAHTLFRVDAQRHPIQYINK